MERTNRKKIGISNWNEILLENFATSLGASLDVLEQEYDDMIKAFELQVSKKLGLLMCFHLGNKFTSFIEIFYLEALNITQIKNKEFKWKK